MQVRLWRFLNWCPQGLADFFFLADDTFCLDEDLTLHDPSLAQTLEV
jgi:hypothetical protein